MSSAESRAVFISYSSDDVEAAQRIATALHEAGIEVWFDRSELRGGDAWDQNIRRQIKECVLFMPIISAISGNTGLQSAAIIIRGLSTGHVDLRHWRRCSR